MRSREDRRLKHVEVTRCGKCRSCAEEKIQDWIGRCQAEANFAKDWTFVTLTYAEGIDFADGKDHAQELVYDDVSRFIRRMRDAGLKVRFLAVGEHGELKGRAHWHVILFWPDGVPADLEDNYERDCWTWEYWPHGYSHASPGTSTGVRYAVEYLHKPGHTSLLRTSKSPPIGGAFFAERARDHVAQALVPYECVYTHDCQRLPDGTKWNYRLHDASARLYVEAFDAEFQRVHPDAELPSNPWLDAVRGQIERRAESRRLAREVLTAESVRAAYLRRRDRFTVRKGARPPAEQAMIDELDQLSKERERAKKRSGVSHGRQHNIRRGADFWRAPPAEAPRPADPFKGRDLSRLAGPSESNAGYELARGGRDRRHPDGVPAVIRRRG